MMAAESYKKHLRDEMICSICRKFFTEPVTLDCGHNFCCTCISECWRESPTCPQCRQWVPDPKSLGTNRQLANVVQIMKEQSKLPSGRAVCEVHQEPLELFCLDDRAPICLVCSRSSKHQAHRVVPVEEAGLFLLQKTVRAEREKVAAAFSRQRQFLEEQEKLLQAEMDELEKEIVGRRDEHQASLSAELSSLDNLQDFESILERCPVENPMAFPVALKCYQNRCLEDIMKKSQDSLINGLPLQKANVTLDPATANCQLVLSEDGKSVRHADEAQFLPDNPERFNRSPCVLGLEGFTAGRHYWEVAVGSEGEWKVGVARESVSRKGSIWLDPDAGFWDFGVCKWECRVAIPPDHTPLSWSQELKKIRVMLNYEAGQVAFFNADSADHLYTYSGACFGGETLLPFFYVRGKAHLTLLS